MNITQKLTKAKIQVMLRSPFFSYKLLHMPVVIDNSIKTANTDGYKISINEQWAESLQEAELTGVMSHESCHCLFGHHLRTGNRNPKKANLAMDMAINPILKSGGFILPDSAVYPERFGLPPDLAWERYYEMLPDNPDGKDGGGDGEGDGQGNDDPGGCGGVSQPKNGQGQAPSKTELEQMEAEAKQQLAAAFHCGRMAGKMPAGLERLIQEMLEPKVDWKEILSSFLKEMSGKADYKWTVPNRRFLHTGFILPSILKSVGSSVAVVVDTSGSIDDKQLQEFASEIDGIVSEAHLDTHVIYCDTDIAGTEFFEAGDSVQLHGCGGGGTDFTKPFEWVRENTEDVCAVVYLTDACGSCGIKDFEIPTIWAITSNGDKQWEQPFGTKIFLEK